MRYPIEVRVIPGYKRRNPRLGHTTPTLDELNEEVVGIAESLGYSKTQRHSFDDSQENELQLCTHGALDTNLGSLDF
jgi:hypothetical protein